MVAVRPLMGRDALLATILVTIGTSQTTGYPATTMNWPWFNTSLPIDARVDALVGAMNSTELITQLVKYSQRIDRLGVPAYPWHMEAAHGIASGGTSTVFPCSMARAASFDTELEYKIAQVTGVEARAKWNVYLQKHGTTPPYNAEELSLTLYAPEMNLCRDPRWGRCQESRGEDPFLTSALVPAFVKGLQNHPLSTTRLLTTAMLKDFVVYNIESNTPVGGTDKQYRLKYNAIVSEADLRQSFLPAFEAGVVEGDVRSIMTSYHALNGIPETAHPLIKSELRDRLGWEGMMISDGGAVSYMLNFDYLNLSMTKNLTTVAAAALNAGVDLNSGGWFRYNKSETIFNMTGFAYGYLEQALDLGLVDLAVLQQSAKRVLKLRFELGLFDPPEDSPFAQFGAADLASPEHLELARQSAAESLVLLTNKDKMLPLDLSKLNKIALIGPNANNTGALLSNYNACNPTRKYVNANDTSPPCTLVTPLDALQEKLKTSAVELKYLPGVDLAKSLPTDNSTIASAAILASQADVAILVLGLESDGVIKPNSPGDLEDEANDRVSIKLPPQQLILLQRVIKAQPNTILVLMSGGMISEPEIMSTYGIMTPKAIIQQFYSGSEGGNALASSLFGETEFSGRLPVSVVHNTSQIPPYLVQNLSMWPGRTHRYLEVDPLYPFGYGLTSHPTSYSSLDVSPKQISRNNGSANISVTIDLACEGPAGSQQTEIVQVYFGLLSNSSTKLNVTRQDREIGERSIPLHDLRGFKRVKLQCSSASLPITTKQTISISRASLKLMDFDGEMKLIEGVYGVWVGGTSPRTPPRLLRTKAQPCAPQIPLRSEFEITK